LRRGRCPTRLGGFEWGSAGGLVSLPSAPRRRRLEKSSSPTGSLPPSAPRASGSLYLSSPLERRRGRGQDCSSARPEARTAAARRSGAGVVVAVVRTGGGELLVSHLLLRRPSPWSGVVRTCGGGTGVPFVTALRMPVFFVHCGCRGLNMYATLARSRVFSSFSSTKSRLLII
jgi:hypothetical protein